MNGYYGCSYLQQQPQHQPGIIYNLQENHHTSTSMYRCIDAHRICTYVLEGMMSASYVQVELKNDNDANVWFRFCYESKESNASVDIHEAVIPKQYRRVYIKIPTGAGK